MCKQYNKQGKFLLGQTEFMPRAAHVVRGRIDRKIFGNTAQFPPYGLSTAPAAAAQHLRCQNAR